MSEDLVRGRRKIVRGDSYWGQWPQEPPPLHDVTNRQWPGDARRTGDHLGFRLVLA